MTMPFVTVRVYEEKNEREKEKVQHYINFINNRKYVELKENYILQSIENYDFLDTLGNKYIWCFESFHI